MKTLILFFIAVSCFAQGKANVVQTGLVNAANANWIPPTSTFASPPASPATGSLYVFTDASASGTCAGTGSALAYCRWSGSAWVSVSGAGSVAASCQLAGPGDGLNALTAGTYLQSFCYNFTASTWTITGIKCNTDNSGTSTLSATNGAGTALLTGAITCTPSFAAGTQSGTTTIASGDYIKFSFVADGTSKQSTWVVNIQ